jgi:hypothetical protein
MIQEEDTTKFLDEATPWEGLSPSAQAYFGTPAQFQQRILDYFFDHQKPHGSALTFIQPNQYYQKLIEFGVEKFLVFPYHLIPELQRYHAVVPFNYYCDMLLKVMANERSYQSIPNFSAVDAVRVTGVGRNQFIDAMNKSRSGGWSSLLKSKDKVLRALLPQAPMKIPLQSWWRISTVPVPENKLAKLPASQRLSYERAAALKAPGSELRTFSEADIRSLYNEGLLYISIPLSPQDTVKLLTMENFVMNRVGGDYLEGLCYKSFISIDDRTTVEQLARMLAVDVSEIAKVLSLFIRLGLAAKVTPEEVDASADAAARRLAAVYDCNLPASLMLGNLGGVVKSYAVMLFEVGRMADKTVTDFITALQKVESPIDESMASCHEKCNVIARIGTFLKSRPLGAAGLDMVRLENLLDLDDDSRSKMFERNYEAAVALAPLTFTKPSLSIPGVVHFGPPSPLFHSPWVMLYLHAIAHGGPPVYVWPQGDIVTTLPRPFFVYESVRLFKWRAESVVVPTTTLLISLNDALPSSPVLVQCFEKPGETISEIGFPSDTVEPELATKFALSSLFGYLKFVTDGEGKKWPIDVLYGVPTVSLALCNQVIEQIEKGNMLGEENIAKMKDDVAKVSAELDEFVKTWSCNIGRPVRPLYARDGVIQWL